jgi:CheY-like chemotaxis protein
MLAWLHLIRQTAKAGIERNPLPEPIIEKPEASTSQVIEEAVDEFRHNTDGTFDIFYDSSNGLPSPAIPFDMMKSTVLEFLTSALFGSGKGSITLSSNGTQNAIVLEIKGERLSPVPRNQEKPEWLSRIGGRIDIGRQDSESGHHQESWRLMIPLAGKPLPELPQHPPIVKVLAIDSQEVIRDLLTGMLGGLGYNSIVVGSSEEALRLVKVNIEVSKPFTHIVTDYALDNITGLELARDVKALEPDTFVILISSLGLSPDPELAAKMGVDRILKKPFRMEQLAEIIKNSHKGIIR